MLLTPKQEAFVHGYIETGNASEAYRRAYDAKKMQPETVNRKAKELLDNGKIAARVEALRADAVQRHRLTVDDLIAELEEARKTAQRAEKPQAATMGKAKLLGLDVNRSEITGKDGGPIETRPVRDLTDEELAAELARYGLEP